MNNKDYSTVLEAIYQHSLTRPDRLCLADIDTSITYKEAWEKIVSASFYLKEAGINKGDKVLLRGRQKVDYLIAFFALHYMGAIACPVERAIKEDRILEIIDAVGAKAYISDKKAKLDSFPVLSIKDMYSYKTEKEIDLDNPVLPEKDAVAEILFTTGTTGKSKGIVISHANDLAIAQNIVDGVAMSDNEVELITAPLSHSLAIRRLMGVMYKGGTAVVSDGVKYVQDFFRMCNEYSVTALTFVPAILDQLLLAAKDEFESLNTQLNYIQLGAAPLSEADKNTLCQMFPNTRLYNMYGATESGCSTILEFSKYRDRQKCIGRPTINTRVLFVDDDRNEINSSQDAPAILAFAGAMNMQEYYGEPELTREYMDDAGIVYTNDIGYLGEDGYVYLVGRRGEVINVGGIKVAPTEIEEALIGFEGIRDCACVGVEDEITGQAVKMFVELEDDYQFNEADVVKYLANKLEKLKLPRQYEVIDKIPRSFNGKILRKELVK